MIHRQEHILERRRYSNPLKKIVSRKTMNNNHFTFYAKLYPKNHWLRTVRRELFFGFPKLKD